VTLALCVLGGWVRCGLRVRGRLLGVSGLACALGLIGQTSGTSGARGSVCYGGLNAGPPCRDRVGHSCDRAHSLGPMWARRTLGASCRMLLCALVSSCWVMALWGRVCVSTRGSLRVHCDWDFGLRVRRSDRGRWVRLVLRGFGVSAWCRISGCVSAYWRYCSGSSCWILA
jgi:hypothetical protein